MIYEFIKNKYYYYFYSMKLILEFHVINYKKMHEFINNIIDFYYLFFKFNSKKRMKEIAK